MRSQTGSTQKINIIILLAGSFVFLVGLLAWFALDRVEKRIRADTGDALETVLQTTRESLTLWAQNNQFLLTRLGENPQLVALVERQLTVPPRREDLVTSPALSKLRDLFGLIEDRFETSDLFIISPDLINIASMQNASLGLKNLIAGQRLDLLNRVFQGEAVMVPPVWSMVEHGLLSEDSSGTATTMFFVAPIKKTNGDVIAAIARQIGPEKDFTRLIQLGQMGESGETYAFDSYGRLLSESRFDEGLHEIGLITKGQRGILSIWLRDPGGNLMKGFAPKVSTYQQPMTLMADQATKGQSGTNVEGYRDYRGIRVYGTWLWDKQLGIGLATEIDEDEALVSYYTTRTVVIILLGVTVILALGSLLFAVLIDERANRALRRSHDELEMRVEERTAELRKLSRATEDSPASVVITDKSGMIEYVNPTFTEVTGYTTDEAIGKNPRILKSGNLPSSFYEGLWNTILAGDIWRGDLINRRKDGTDFWESASISPIKNDDGDISHFVAVKQDITDRKKMEEALIQARQAADDASKAKSDFLANMSHEIRTPMNAVIGMTHLALKTDLSTKQRDYLSKIQSSARSLLGIINDILDFSKIEAGKLDMESVDFNLDEVMENLANLITVKAQEKKGLEVLFDVAADVPRNLNGDSLRLGQILINLGSNAVKFTEAGEIVFSCELVNRNDEQVTLKFAVTDTGIGLNDEQVDKLFTSFSQADTSTTRKYGGTGLGLAISKKLVNLMGGKIWAKSSYGKGTTFNFTAEFSVGEEKIKEVALPSKDMRGMKVLVVDDNATSRRILKDLLESFSFNVSLAVSGEEGIDEIERADTDDPFELVLMDWKMPGINGIEAAARIKNHSELTHKPPIILVTAYGREEVLQDAENVGLDGFLLKPVNPSVLFDSVVMAFGKEGLEPTDYTKEEIGSAEKMKEIEGAKVLLVEDNEINQQVAREILEEAGLSVTLASNGQEAVEAVTVESFDAVLMDIQMPVMDGYTATKKIRNLSSDIRNVPIVAMTAHAMAGDAERSLAAGMNDHVTKPIDPDQLLSTLEKWISPKKGRDRSREISVAEKLKSARTEPTVNELPETLPGFDLDEGLTRLQDNRKLYIKLLQGFSRNYAAAVSEIKAAVESQDWRQAQHRVHDIKGLAGNLAAKQLHVSAAEFEQLLKDMGSNHSPTPKEVDQKFAALIQNLTQALEAVQTLGEKRVNSSAQHAAEERDRLPPDLANEFATRIRKAVEIGDVTQLTAIADDLMAQSETYAPYSEEIVRMADDFDFEGLIELADGLTG